jgi:hypothetical protein
MEMGARNKPSQSLSSPEKSAIVEVAPR